MRLTLTVAKKKQTTVTKSVATLVKNFIWENSLGEKSEDKT